MIPLAPHLTAFLRERLAHDIEASPHTCDTYAYAFQLLVAFASEKLRTSPSALAIEQLDARFILTFLDHLEAKRGNSARTRNARLAAIKSFVRFLEYRVPSALEQFRRILAIPAKRYDRRLVGYLERDEVQALLDGPDPTTRQGIRDRALLHLAVTAGLRVSELVGLQLDDLVLRPQSLIHIHGKGRRERCLPLWKETVGVLRAWLAVRGESAGPELFPNSNGTGLTRSGFAYILRKYVTAAREQCPSVGKKRVSPHVLRHTCAINALGATQDVRKVALWLGHASIETTEVYLQTDPRQKLDTIDAILPATLRRGRFRAPDKLIAALTPAKRTRATRPTAARVMRSGRRKGSR